MNASLSNNSSNNQNHTTSLSKRFDLENRSLIFAQSIRRFVDQLPKSIRNIEDCKQLVRSSGSIGANYIEANESLSKKDFIMRVKISKKETRETIWWLELLLVPDTSKTEHSNLMREATELMKIFGAIIRNSK